MALKVPYLGIFGIEFEKAVVISEISALEFLKNDSLTHTVNFGIGATFSKGPGSDFPESQGPVPVLGPVPIYKVCQLHPK